MPATSPPLRLSEVREALREGSVAIITRFGDGELARAIALQTTVSLDGDVLTRVDPRALTRPDFDELLERHHAELRVTLSRCDRLVSRYSRWLPRLLGSLVVLLYGCARGVNPAPVQRVTALLGAPPTETMYAEVLNFAVVCVVGLGLAQVSRRSISRWLSAPEGRPIYPRS